jgi:uncharacterized protein YwlG (UPF0340 family)
MAPGSVWGARPAHESPKAIAEAVMNAVKDKYQHSKVASELQVQDLGEINRAMDLKAMSRSIKYHYKYPELPEREEAPAIKYLIGA